ncbi:hypothetical protein AMECASPLE_019586 [Ameca splendens]|uniref:Secreted protein n=1 Tax=Ameca splendens TaxID=208324 RepID=A0ABV0YRA0_9TELE
MKYLLCFYATGAFAVLKKLGAVCRRNDSSNALTVLPADHVFISLHEAERVEQSITNLALILLLSLSHFSFPVPPTPSVICLLELWRSDGLTELLSLCGK